MSRKICVVVTARPSYSRIRSVLEAIREHPDLELQLVVAASALLDRYGNAQRVIEEEGFHIDRRVYMIMEGENLVTSAKSTGFGLAELATANQVLCITHHPQIAALADASGYSDRDDGRPIGLVAQTDRRGPAGQEIRTCRRPSGRNSEPR